MFLSKNPFTSYMICLSWVNDVISNFLNSSCATAVITESAFYVGKVLITSIQYSCFNISGLAHGS